jgi:hypothetical protein
MACLTKNSMCAAANQAMLATSGVACQPVPRVAAGTINALDVSPIVVAKPSFTGFGTVSNPLSG